jgi:mono/diheme cytochrome c family protein
MIDRYVSPAEFRRLIQALLGVLGLIAIAAVFGFLIVPGMRNMNQPGAESPVVAVQGETGWLDPTDYPASVRQVIPPIDPATVMTPNPKLMARGKAVYAQTCATCHGLEGKGDGPGATGLTPKPRNFAQAQAWKNGTKIEDIYRTLEEGVKGSSMVSYSDLSKRDRMALAHVVQSMGAFDHGASDPKALASLEKVFASAGEVIPNRIPVPRAVQLLNAEFHPALGRLPGSDALLTEALIDPARAYQSLEGIAGWKDSDQALAKGVVAGLPGNGFGPVVATYSPLRWRELRSALASH